MQFVVTYQADALERINGGAKEQRQLVPSAYVSATLDFGKILRGLIDHSSHTHEHHRIGYGREGGQVFEVPNHAR